MYEENSPKIEKEIFELGIPILGMCYGMQFMAHTLGGEVKSADNREFGKTPTKVDTTSPLFKGLEEDQVVWMSHVDYAAKVPEGFEIVAHTKDCPVAVSYTHLDVYKRQVWKSRDVRITLEQAATPPVNTVICLSGFHK